eukprot:6479869-Amphidinium_carterae.1
MFVYFGVGLIRFLFECAQAFPDPEALKSPPKVSTFASILGNLLLETFGLGRSGGRSSVSMISEESGFKAYSPVHKNYTSEFELKFLRIISVVFAGRARQGVLKSYRCTWRSSLTCFNLPIGSRLTEIALLLRLSVNLHTYVSQRQEEATVVQRGNQGRDFLALERLLEPAQTATRMTR